MKTWKTPKGTELPIMDMRGKDYLEVKWRLVWFREEHPDWSISTSFVSGDATSALARAEIRSPAGTVMSTSHKFEDKQGFADFREKAETGAIGRALALIGYGTQFCGDELDEGDRLADSPVSKPNPYAAKNHQPDSRDGIHDTTYRVTFGKFSGRTLEQIYHDPAQGPKAMMSYVKYLEDTAAKAGKPLGQSAVDLIKHFDEFLGAMENSVA